MTLSEDDSDIAYGVVSVREVATRDCLIGHQRNLNNLLMEVADKVQVK